MLFLKSEDFFKMSVLKNLAMCASDGISVFFSNMRHKFSISSSGNVFLQDLIYVTCI